MDALIVIFVSGLISLFAAFARKPWVVLGTATTGLLAAITLFLTQMMYGHSFIHLNYEGLEFDNFAQGFGLVASIFALLIIGVGFERFKEKPEHTGEYIGLLMFSLCGALIMTAFTDMFMFFLGLEIMSIPIYVMVGSKKTDVRSTEASLKYFLTGSFATGVLLFGIAWVYGATGSFSLNEIGNAVSTAPEMSSMLLIGILLILASFVFKVGAAPFHFWSPDVYDGAPHAVTGFMASVVKMAAFGAFLRLFTTCFGYGEVYEFWSGALAVLTVITLFVGNLSALRQVKLKRLLAYSSITHVGYTLLVILTMKLPMSAFDLWFYMAAYGFSIIAIITVGIVINDEEDRIDALKGLAKRNPFMAVVAVVAVLSLAGVPPTAGFFGKYMVFTHAWNNWWWLVIIALINSAISIYYYLRMIGTIVNREEEAEKIKLSPITGLVLFICLVGMLCLPFVTVLF